jgi:hypothetical protein
MKRKFLHVEMNDHGLCLYVDEKKRKSKVITLDDIDCECCVAEPGEKVNFVLNLEQLVKDLLEEETKK